MKLRRARAVRRGRVEIVPMIDVMLFLLVTFILASLSLQSLNSLPVNLPQGRAANMERATPVTLTVTGDSRLFVDKTPATLKTLAPMLKGLLRGREPSIIVAADRAAPEGTVVEAMLQARQAGVRHFLIAVQHDG